MAANSSRTITGSSARRVKRRGSSMDDDQTGRIAELLDHFAGPGEGRHVLERLVASADPPRSIAIELAGSAQFERLYKAVHTGHSTPKG
jgi:hypothetical protein